MIKAWVADGHVSESEVAFLDKCCDPEVKDGTGEKGQFFT